MLTGNSSGPADSAGIVLAAPFYFVLALAVSFLLDFLKPTPLVAQPLPETVGYLIVGLSFVLLWLVDREFSACETSSSCRLGDSALIVSGPFRFSRNPGYLAMAVMLIGLALTTNSLWLIVMIAPGCYAVYRFCIRKEEAYLERKFGDNYRRYRNSVRRWF